MPARTLLAIAWLAIAALALTGCATPGDHVSIKKEFLTDSKSGHVVGERETFRSTSTGETFERVEMFAVLHGVDGKPVTYEQRVPNGTIVRDSSGEPIGWRHSDSRSRGTSPQGGSLGIIIH